MLYMQNETFYCLFQRSSVIC